MPSLTTRDRCRLYFEVHGDGSPLVLLEGMGGDIPGWRRNIPHLAAEHRVIAYDLRGNGRSDAPEVPATMTTFVGDTLELLDALDARPAHVYGQSFGGMVGLELALSHPDAVRSLVLASTHAGARRASRPAPSANVPKDRPYLALYSPAFAAQHPEHVEADRRIGARSRQPAHAARRQWEAMQAWDAWDRLGEIRCPVLVLHGTEDRVVGVENGRRLARAIAGARLVLLEGAGHVYHSEQPEAADDAVLEFLRSVDAR